ncbi:MAG TPA: methyltransferase domain-containing protein [Actinomycetota bacterium]
MKGRVRFELLLGQVLEALPPAPARVVDVGGGTGQLAVALARRGYQVTVVDISPAMLATCAQRAAGEGEEVSAKVATLQGDATQVAGMLGPASQDAALCHEVVSCVEDPGAVLAALGQVLRPGGVLSLTFVNRDWLVLRAGRQGAFPAALRLLDKPVNPGDEPAAAPAPGAGTGTGTGTAVTLDELERQLARAGFEPAGAAGVSVFAEARHDDLDSAELTQLVELERRVAGREPYRSSSHIVHLVGKRASDGSSLPRYTR